MQKFACKNLGLDCNYVATGSTKEEVVSQAMQHGGSAHADIMKNMTKEQSADFAKKLEASIIAA